MIALLVKVFQKNKTNKVYMFRERERLIHYKELAHTGMEAGESKICSVDQQAQGMGEPMVQMKSKGSLLNIPPLLRQAILFTLFRSSTNLMRSTQVIEGHLIYPKSTNLNVNFIHNTFQVDI